MDMKTCGKCGEEKPLEEFSRAAASSDGYQWHCKACLNLAARQNYLDNKDRYYAKAREREAEQRERIRQIKDVPCLDCEGRFDPVCMDFDHLPGQEKVMKISTMIRRHMAWSTIEAEIAKCEVVCSNCHRLRTRDRLEVV